QIFLAGALALALLPGESTAAAQGQSLLDQKLPAGTVTVRVIGGSMDKPVVGVGVEVVLDGEEKGGTARTAGQGRATIPNLRAGQTYRARVKVGDQAVESDPFAMPPQGGVRLLLNAEGEGAGGGGHPGMEAAGAAAMPGEGDEAQADE